MPRGLDTGWFVQPTVSADVDNSMTIAQEEIFGPVLSVIPTRTRPTRSGSPTTRPTGWLAVCGRPTTTGPVDRLEDPDRYLCGQHTYAFDPGAPFGGYKNSGIGRENRARGIDGTSSKRRAAAVRLHADDVARRRTRTIISATAPGLSICRRSRSCSFTVRSTASPFGGGVGQFGAHPDAAVDRHRVEEPHFVQPVVDGQLGVLRGSCPAPRAGTRDSVRNRGRQTFGDSAPWRGRRRRGSIDGHR